MTAKALMKMASMAQPSARITANWRGPVSPYLDAMPLILPVLESIECSTLQTHERLGFNCIGYSVYDPPFGPA